MWSTTAALSLSTQGWHHTCILPQVRHYDMFLLLYQKMCMCTLPLHQWRHPFPLSPALAKSFALTSADHWPKPKSPSPPNLPQLSAYNCPDRTFSALSFNTIQSEMLWPLPRLNMQSCIKYIKALRWRAFASTWDNRALHHVPTMNRKGISLTWHRNLLVEQPPERTVAGTDRVRSSAPHWI